ncbi:MAG: GNAT family N-acetyltransferase [Anaerolineales bacterium]|nr:GNAT family N-acetyltransferase [Anaerolineales bacterium]
MKNLLVGKTTRLSAMDAEELGKAFSNNGRDSELFRLMGTEPTRPHSAKAAIKFFEKMLEEESTPANHYFSIRALEDNRLLGDINLDVINNWGSRDAFVGLGIYAREDWGKGYGTDAMQIALRFAFTELNLRRVTLTVFEYNPRAIRSYEKAGFKREGCLRQALLKDGKRWDLFYMGILREEWLKLNP